MINSTLMSGYLGRSFPSLGHRIDSAACSPVVMRMLPAGFSRSSLKDANSVSISSSRGQLCLSFVRPRP